MIHPLIGYTQGTLYGCEMCNGILCQDGYVIGGDQLRNTVVDLRIDMIWSARQHDAASACLFQISQDFLAL